MNRRKPPKADPLSVERSASLDIIYDSLLGLVRFEHQYSARIFRKFRIISLRRELFDAASGPGCRDLGWQRFIQCDGRICERMVTRCFTHVTWYLIFCFQVCASNFRTRCKASPRLTRRLGVNPPEILAPPRRYRSLGYANRGHSTRKLMPVKR